MCCFSQPVLHVSGTSIFARGVNSTQHLVYSMQYDAQTDLAMVLPIPVLAGSRERAVRFINLEAGVGDPPRLNRYEALLYHTIGHWPTVILTACAGVYFGVKGAARLLSRPLSSS